MSSEVQTLAIDGEDDTYTYDAEAKVHRFEIDGQAYGFKRWTWGEKNRVVSESISLHPTTGQFKIDTGLFNELMLGAVLSEAPFEVTLSNLRELDPVLGDQLLRIAQWVNEISDAEKKR